MDWISSGTTIAFSTHQLVHLNAALNSVATVLLIYGLVQIKRGRRQAHGRAMTAALVVSCLFLLSYLVYHYTSPPVKFTQEGIVRTLYYIILLSHILLACTVPVLAWTTFIFALIGTGYRGAANYSEETRQRYLNRHRKLARWTFPIWLYVSITGVLVYLMLYHLWPPQAA